jgi:predicted dehydrogenase
MDEAPQSRRAFLAGATALGAAGVAMSCVRGRAEAAGIEEGGVQASNTPVPARRNLADGAPIRCAFIGVGNRGSALLRATLDLDEAIDVTAVCDTYGVWRDRALNWCREQYAEAQSYTHFAAMLEAEALDAVVIATPDHVHPSAAMAALDRGLDVYCEKPIALSAKDAKQLAWRATATGAVFQVGTQLRSQPMYQRAREVVQGGQIGDLVLVQVHRHMATDRLTPDDIPNEANESNVDWDAFAAPARSHKRDLMRYFNWRYFRDYSNGYFGDLMLHHLDLCLFLTGAGMPAQVMALGGIYNTEDGRTTPDTVSALVDYGAAGFHFNYTTTDSNGEFGLVERYLGTGGALEIRDMERLTIIRGEAREEVENGGLDNAAHLRGFFRAMRTREETIAPVQAGYHAAAIAHMAMLSADQRAAVAWDAEKEMPVI